MRNIGKLAAISLMLGLAPLISHAVPIGLGSLTGSESVEGFEGLPTDATLPTWVNGWRTPIDGYLFPSDIQFISLNPPNSDGEIIIGDTSIGAVMFSTSDGGNFASPGTPPGGTAFIGDNGPGEDMSFLFPTDVSLAGMFVFGSNELTVNVYDASNSLLESAFFGNPGTAGTWSTNFVGIARPGIRRIEFATPLDHWLGDNLTYSAMSDPVLDVPPPVSDVPPPVSEASVPEPATLALFGLGLVGLGLTRGRRRSI